MKKIQASDGDVGILLVRKKNKNKETETGK